MHDAEPVAPLTRHRAEATIRPLLPTLGDLRDRVRLVGTAASLLEGIELPAGDVDFLARDRAAVDQLTVAAEAAGFAALVAPEWIPWPQGGQYFARTAFEGVVVEYSTAERDGHPSEVLWTTFGTVELDGVELRVEPSELRLATETARNRPDRWVPIARHLARTGYDEALLKASIPAFAAFRVVLERLA